MHSFKGGPSPASLSWSDLQEAHHVMITGDGALQAVGDVLDVRSFDDTDLDDVLDDTGLADALDGTGIDDVLDTLFDSTSGSSDFDPSSNIFDTTTKIQAGFNKVSVMIPTMLYVVNITYPSTTQWSFAGSSILHNILAIPLYASSSFNWQSVDLSKLGTADFDNALANEANLSLAESKYTVSVGLWSVAVYAGVGTLLILFCLTTLVLATFHPISSRLPDYGPYPLFNFWKWLTVVPRDNVDSEAVSDATAPFADLQVQMSTRRTVTTA